MATPQTQTPDANTRGFLGGVWDHVQQQAAPALARIEAGLQLSTNSKNMTTGKFLDTIDVAQPDFSGVTDIMRDNKQLGVAFHDAFSHNEAFRNRLLAPTPDGQENLFSADNLKNILTHKQHGPQAQMLMTNMLQKVANGQLRVEQVEQVAGSGVDMMAVLDDENATVEQKAAAQQKFTQTLEQNGLPTGQIKPEQLMAYLREVMSGDPAGAAANLVGALGLSGEQAAAIQELLTMAGGIMQFLGQPYVEFFNKHAPGMANGATNLFERVTGQRDADIATEQAGLTPAQRAQREISAAANAPGAMQGNATGSERSIEIGQGANQNGPAASAQRDAATGTPERAPEIRIPIPTPRPDFVPVSP